ncbi:aminotransferase class I/II-fold pyridoxal phosphate-dependent enzyme [Saccharopolyspora hattusasensis]|uniref:aminotransferase class I/II-fold pyridoxal phosphate-dependent enzyme n=1 Tax=Saccharopolyspora hattusasensis TaxID=1128679 RepID=UPI003D9830EE
MTVTLSPTAQLRQRAAALRRTGIRVIDFSAGELDLPTPDHVVDAAVAAAHRPENHRYGPTAGNAQLRAAVAERLGARVPQDRPGRRADHPRRQAGPVRCLQRTALPR